MDFEKWQESVPEAIRADSLWKMTAYRLALYLSDLCWQDASILLENKKFSLSDQLSRALGSVSANLAEGYSRSTGRDRALFYQYALGSARESRDWYYKTRFILGEETAERRYKILTEIIRLLVTMIPQQRGYLVREDPAPYETHSP
jgi:four helix bundle protein